MEAKSLLYIVNEISNKALLNTKTLLENIDVIDDPVSMVSLYNGLSGLALLEADIYAYSKKEEDLQRADYYLTNSFNVIKKHIGMFNSGLFIGMAGYVWAECRFIEATGYNNKRATKILDYLSTNKTIRGTKTPIDDIIYGNAGKGLALLYGYRLFGNKTYLSAAYKVAEQIISNRTNDGLWINDSDSINSKLLSFSHGASGILYFLYEMFVTTKEDKFKTVVKETLDILINKMKVINNCAVWQNDMKKSTVTPYWCSGTSGICLLFTKANKAIGNYSDITRMAINSVAVAANGSNAYGLCHGLAGIGEFIIDAENTMHTSFNEDKDKVLSFILSEYVNKMQMQSENRFNHRLSKEFMTGYPGIAHFILRYLDPSIKHFSLL